MPMHTKADPAESDRADDRESDQCGCSSHRLGGVTDVVERHSGLAVLAALAGGVAIGYLAGCVLQRKGKALLAEVESLAQRSHAKQAGRRMLHRLNDILPDAITSRLHR